MESLDYPFKFYNLSPNATVYPTFRHAANDTVVRHKRQLLVAAAALATGLVGTFMGLFNHAEITAISQHLNTLESHNNMLVHIEETHERHINQLVADMSHLTSILESFIQYNPTLLYARLNRQLNIVSERVHALLDTVQQLQSHRLSISLLSHSQLLAMHAEVTSAAAKSNVTPLPLSPQDYFQLDVSYLKSGTQILILLHVPCSSLDNLLTIYKYVPFPFPVFPSSTHSPSLSTIQDLVNLEHSISPTAPQGLIIKADTDLIAIGKNKLGKNQYVILASADLEACYSRAHTYICEHHQIVRSDMEGTCLGALFIQHPEGIEENCRIQKKTLRETVYQLSPTDHLVFSPTPFTTQVICKNGTHTPLKLKATTRISIPEDCSVQLRNHSIHSDYTLRIDPEALHFEWDFNPATLPNSAQLLEGTSHIGPQLDLIRKHLTKLANETIAKEVFAGLLVSHLTSPNWLSILMWSLLAILGCALLVIGLVWYRSSSTGTQIRQQQQLQQQQMLLIRPSAPVEPTQRFNQF